MATLRQRRWTRRIQQLSRSMLAAVAFGSMVSLTTLAQTPPPHGIREFTAPGTFTVPSGVGHIEVELWGAGGGGGGGALTGSSRAPGGGGGGGGSGAYLRASQVVAAGDIYTVTIGTAGRGGAAESNHAAQAGSDGGNTTFGNGTMVLLTANGGKGGLPAASRSSIGGVPGRGGETSTGDWILVRAGASGQRGQTSSDPDSSGSLGGSGGMPVIGTVTPVGTFGGVGGAGGNSAPDENARGADGGRGFAIIVW
jgi:hypothetical protein